MEKDGIRWKFCRLNIAASIDEYSIPKLSDTSGTNNHVSTLLRLMRMSRRKLHLQNLIGHETESRDIEEKTF